MTASSSARPKTHNKLNQTQNPIKPTGLS